jgi:PAS domain S-box-containing protein
MRKSITLQGLITLSVLSLGLLLGTIGVSYTYWQAKASLRQAVGVTFQEIARQSAVNAGLLLTREVEWIERLSALPTVRTAARQGARLTFDAPDLKRIREEQQRYFTSMVIVDRNGQPAGGVISDATRAHYRQQPWWPVVFDQGRVWAGGLHRDGGGRWQWEIAVPVRETAGPVIGALKVVIGREDLLASILQSRIGETGHVMLLDAAGMVVACAVLDPAQHGRFLEFDGASPAAAAWTEIMTDTHGGRDGIAGVAAVQLRPDIVYRDQWTVLVEQAPEEMYVPLLALTSRLALFGLAAVGFIVLLRWRLARRIAAPIRKLVGRIRAWDRVQTSPAAEDIEPTGIEEIDALAASFEDLAARLDAASRESRRYVGELEAAHRELVQSEEHYRMLWNHSLHLRLLVGRDGVIRALNRRGEIKFWKAAVNVVGTSVLSLFGERDRPLLQKLLEDVFTTGKEGMAGELRVPAPAGDYFIMDVDLVPIEKQGAVDTVMVQLTDLTEKKHLQEQLLRSERLASLSQFASLFAHDIRNPLAGVKKTLELMAQRPELGADPVRHWCEDLLFTVEQLQGMINDMLDVYQEHYSGLPLMTTSVGLTDLIRGVIRLFRLEAEAREIRFDLRIPDVDLVLEADRRRLERVLSNLVHNALKYSPPGGLVTVSARSGCSEGARSASNEICSDGDCVTLAVEDEGPGIRVDELPHLFEMFFRPQNGQDWRIGRGLGLYFCRLVIEGHHGVIRAANRAGGGACFEFALPVGKGSHVHQAAYS